MQQLRDRAAALGVYLSMGYSQRDAVTGTLYNSNMMIAPDGRAMNHRKLKPTGSERVVWGDADLDMQKVPASRMELDCVGHYARPDVLELRVDDK